MSSEGTAKKVAFLLDMEEISRRGRQQIMEGVVTPNYKGDRKTVVRILNQALASEFVCMPQAVAEEFFEHASEEQGHSDEITERIVQLDAEPNVSPGGMLMRSHSDYLERESLIDMIREDLMAGRVAIESLSEVICYLSDDEPSSRRMMEDLLANEEEHAEDMKTLLEIIGKEEKEWNH